MTAARLLLATLALTIASAASGQQAPQGQEPTKDFAISYKNMDKHPVLGWVPSTPVESNQIGVWQPNGPNDPGGILPTAHGLLEFTMPTGQFWTIGLEITQFLYEDSTAQEFNDFGSLDQPVLLPVAHYPLDYPAGDRMWQHLSDQTMWAFNAGPPDYWMSWTTTFPPVFGTGPKVTIMPLGGPGSFFNQIMAALPSISVPPPTSPGGGALVGMNIILQMAVAENDPLPPAPTRYLMSNAWGLQAMAAPVLKINSGDGGNFGPAGATRELRASFPNIGAQVQLDSLAGARIPAPTTVVDGSTLGYTPPPFARSGPITVSSPTGDVEYERPLVHVVTHGVPVDIAVDAPNPVTRVVDGTPVFGMSFFGTATNTVTLINFPDIPDGVVFDLEAKFYALNRTSNVAGFDDGNATSSSIPIAIGLGPEGSPVNPVQIPNQATPIGNGGNVRIRRFMGLTGGQDIAIKSTSAALTFDYLVVLRAYATGTVTVTP